MLYESLRYVLCAKRELQAYAQNVALYVMNTARLYLLLGGLREHIQQSP